KLLSNGPPVGWDRLVDDAAARHSAYPFREAPAPGRREAPPPAFASPSAAYPYVSLDCRSATADMPVERGRCDAHLLCDLFHGQFRVRKEPFCHSEDVRVPAPSSPSRNLRHKEVIPKIAAAQLGAEMNLQGKTILITGAARACCKAQRQPCRCPDDACASRLGDFGVAWPLPI